AEYRENSDSFGTIVEVGGGLEIPIEFLKFNFSGNIEHKVNSKEQQEVTRKKTIKKEGTSWDIRRIKYNGHTLNIYLYSQCSDSNEKELKYIKIENEKTKKYEFLSAKLYEKFFNHMGGQKLLKYKAYDSTEIDFFTLEYKLEEVTWEKLSRIIEINNF